MRRAADGRQLPAGVLPPGPGRCRDAPRDARPRTLVAPRRPLRRICLVRQMGRYRSSDSRSPVGRRPVAHGAADRGPMQATGGYSMRAARRRHQARPDRAGSTSGSTDPDRARHRPDREAAILEFEVPAARRPPRPGAPTEPSAEPPPSSRPPATTRPSAATSPRCRGAARLPLTSTGPVAQPPPAPHPRLRRCWSWPLAGTGLLGARYYAAPHLRRPVRAGHRRCARGRRAVGRADRHRAAGGDPPRRRC